MSALKSYGASILAAITSLGALDPSTFLPFLPPDVAHWVVVGLAACAAITHLVTAIKKTPPPGSGTAASSLATMLLIASIVTLSLSVTACDMPFKITTPYGNLSNSQAGGTVYTPPIEPIKLHSGK